MNRRPSLSKQAKQRSWVNNSCLKRVYKATALLSLSLICLCKLSISAFAQAAAAPHAMKIGVDVDNWSGQSQDPRFEASLVAMKVDFVNWHIQPAQETQAYLAPMVLLCRKHGWGYTFNNEWANYNRTDTALMHSDGTFRYDFADSTLQLLKSDPLFLGVIYDENELMQSLNGVQAPDGSGTVQPYFAQTASMTTSAAFDAVATKVQQLQQRYASYGKRLIFEMVLPDNAHAYARGGALLAPKMLKETHDDLMYAVYRGAATEYHSQELWTCVDLWFLNNFPTSGVGGPGFHTPQQLIDALNFANAAGFDYAYVEQYKGLMDANFNLTAYGQAVVTFQQSKASAKRGDWRTVQVQGYVRRFPDGYWGQQYSTFIPDHPYGSWLPNPYRSADAQWFALLQTLSNGALPNDADTWDAVTSPFFQNRPYTTMAGLPDFLVLDHYGVIPQGVPSVDLCAAQACAAK
jgi:hypothetical protein